MESEVLSQNIEWECRRVAMALGVKEWEPTETETPFLRYQTRLYQSENIWEWIKWELNPVDGTLFSIEISDYGSVCHLFDASCWPDRKYKDSNRKKYWVLYEHPRYNGRMAFGLYRLGFEEENIIAELNHPLSAHEKLELRFSMPREFWPKKWSDEADELQRATQ